MRRLIFVSLASVGCLAGGGWAAADTVSPDTPSKRHVVINVQARPSSGELRSALSAAFGSPLGEMTTSKAQAFAPVGPANVAPAASAALLALAVGAPLAQTPSAALVAVDNVAAKPLAAGSALAVGEPTPQTLTASPAAPQNLAAPSTASPALAVGGNTLPAPIAQAPLVGASTNVSTSAETRAGANATAPLSAARQALSAVVQAAVGAEAWRPAEASLLAPAAGPVARLLGALNVAPAGPALVTAELTPPKAEVSGASAAFVGPTTTGSLALLLPPRAASPANMLTVRYELMLERHLGRHHPANGQY